MQKELSESKKEYQKIYDFALKFVEKKMQPFTSDDIKAEYLKENKEIVHKDLMGYVINNLSRNGFIKFNQNYIRSKNKVSKGNLLKEWISIKYSESQSKKRISEDTLKARELEKSQGKLEL